MWAAAEPFTLGALFTPEAREAIAELGVSGLAGFMAVRGAPLGRASSAVVAAAFHGFPRDMFADVLTPLWEKTDPEAVIEAHRGSLPVMATRVYADSVDAVRLERLGDRLAAVTAELDTAGRPLAAGNQALPASSEPWAKFWQASSTLREYRGDGHIAVLLAADLDVLEAQVLTATWAKDHIDADFLRKSRQYSDDAWAATSATLTERGLLTVTGELSEVGRALRDDIEDRTDVSAARAWNTLSESDAADLYAFFTELSTRMIDSGGMPAVTPVGAPWPPPTLTKRNAAHARTTATAHQGGDASR